MTRQYKLMTFAFGVGLAAVCASAALTFWDIDCGPARSLLWALLGGLTGYGMTGALRKALHDSVDDATPVSIFVRPTATEGTTMNAIPSNKLARIIESESGCPFKTSLGTDNRSDVWDTMTSEGTADVVTINRGDGFEQAICVQTQEGMMFYVGPFDLEQLPSDERMLLFRCTGRFYVKGRGLKVAE